jgi:hypothetical protein
LEKAIAATYNMKKKVIDLGELTVNAKSWEPSDEAYLPKIATTPKNMLKKT